jgi:bile acid:Na+ symporter, BASS family
MGSIDRIINVLVTVTLIEMMVATGLSVTLADLAGTCKDWRLVLRAALANYVCVPAATVALLLWFKPQPMVSTGFLILAVCPGAPYGPPFTAIAKGSVPIAVGLMAILAGSSAIIAPVLLHNLLLLFSEHEPLLLDAPKIAVTLLLTQLAPLCLGVALRERRSTLASMLQGPAALISKVLNLIVVGLILITQFQLLTDIRPLAFLGMLILLVMCCCVGWILGGSHTDARKAMALTTALRNVGVGLVIATGTFAGTPAVTAVLAYGIIEIIGSLLLAFGWKFSKDS